MWNDFHGHASNEHAGFFGSECRSEHRLTGEHGAAQRRVPVAAEPVNEWKAAWRVYINDGKMSRSVQTAQLTECHFTGFAQLGVMSLLHLLVGQDLFQSSCQEHVFCLFALKHDAPEFRARCAWSQPRPQPPRTSMYSVSNVRLTAASRRT